jgi:uncharacterized LabA/DUF88 family protein
MIRRRKYDKWVSKLRRIHNFVVREGRCQKVNGDYHQKGVDTLITMDLMTIPAQKSIKTIILVSCDTDFVPILKQIQEKGLKVILFYYNDFIRGSTFSMSNHILDTCPENVLITKEQLEKSKYVEE